MTIKAPAQYTCKQEIDRINADIAKLTESTRNPYIDQARIRKDIIDLEKQKKNQKSKLRKLQNSAATSSRHRKKRRKQIIKYSQQNPDDLACIVKETPGRPHIELYYPEFSSILMDIVNHHCATGQPFTFIVIQSSFITHHST